MLNKLKSVFIVGMLFLSIFIVLGNTGLLASDSHDGSRGTPTPIGPRELTPVIGPLQYPFADFRRNVPRTPTCGSNPRGIAALTGDRAWWLGERADRIARASLLAVAQWRRCRQLLRLAYTPPLEFALRVLPVKGKFECLIEDLLDLSVGVLDAE